MSARWRSLAELAVLAVVITGTIWGGYWLRVPGFHTWHTQVYGVFLMAGWYIVGHIDLGTHRRRKRRE